MARILSVGDRYSTGAIWFHWSIALLVIVNLALGLFNESLLDGLTWVMPVHKATGITVLVLTAGRVLWRLLNPPPPLPAALRGWHRNAAHATHAAFYALLVLLPLSGWAFVSGAATRRPLTWFGLFDIPYLPVSRAVGGIAKEAHEIMGFTMLALVVIHIAAALWHHFRLRDTVLARMLPAVAPKR